MKKILTCTALIFSATTAFSAPAVYDCNFGTSQTRGWIAKNAIYTVDVQNGTADVIDGHINHYLKKPIRVDFKTRSNGALKMQWKLNEMKSHNRSSKAEKPVRVTYTLDLKPAQLSAKIKASIRGVHQQGSVFATGSCKLK